MNILHEFYRHLTDDVAMLQALVAIGSPTHDAAAVTRVQKEIQKAFESLGLACRLIPEVNRGMHLLARSDAARQVGRSQFLVAHADSVHDVDPIHDRLRIEGKLPDVLPDDRAHMPVVKAYGPGALDLKGGVVCIVSALRHLARNGLLHQLPITVFVNSCEEDGTNHSVEFIAGLTKQATAALVFEFGRSGDQIVTQRKGLRTYCMTTAGEAAHSGLANTTNAIGRLFEIGRELESLNDSARGVRINFGIVNGGTKVNVVAEKARLEFEVRAAMAVDLNRVDARLQEIASRGPANIERTSEIPPMEESPESTQLFESYSRHGKMLGLNCDRATIQGGVSDANLFAAAGVPTIDGLGPWGENAHTSNEYVDLASIPYKAANLVSWLLDRT